MSAKAKPFQQLLYKVRESNKNPARIGPTPNPSTTPSIEIQRVLQTKEREAVASSLPNSMHTGQIIMLTKMLTSADLRFYEFDAGAPVERWHSGSS
jgi:hypothetical protein